MSVSILHCLSIVLLAVTIVITSCSEKPANRSIEPVELEIYSAALDHYFDASRYNSLLVERYTIEIGDMSGVRRIARHNRWGDVSVTVDLQRKNGTPGEITGGIRPILPVILVEPDLRAAGACEPSDFPASREFIPGTQGITSFSRAGISNDGKHSIVVMRNAGVPFAGFSMIVYLTQEDGRWRVADNYLLQLL